jgi:hypothetical protein
MNTSDWISMGIIDQTGAVARRVSKRFAVGPSHQAGF